MSSSTATTSGVRVDVVSRFDPTRSNPESGTWFFLYQVRITNESEVTVQLTHRHWVIADGNGQVDEVRGAGVVGKQPMLAPGEHFEYTSGCPLTTQFGIMHGTYRIKTDAGDAFDAEVAPFQLGEPETTH